MQPLYTALINLSMVLQNLFIGFLETVDGTIKT